MRPEKKARKGEKEKKKKKKRYREKPFPRLLKLRAPVSTVERDQHSML
jgi:hypothetical protein